ncbi:uncharacterized protein LOC112689660 [Sipha flava]|uniref:Uncharacterized protein LOC112689660 n=1 Tax=Sipha flava TaxID=143950 RepID=A0A8B8G7S1_9HEMI|nr:uncharacterized protein LOC112689660 [Sipha flava]XP_025419274.1 uncharacterized protein LOC112689660 [Sipha flava]
MPELSAVKNETRVRSKGWFNWLKIWNINNNDRHEKRDSKNEFVIDAPRRDTKLKMFNASRETMMISLDPDEDYNTMSRNFAGGDKLRKWSPDNRIQQYSIIHCNFMRLNKYNIDAQTKMENDVSRPVNLDEQNMTDIQISQEQCANMDRDEPSKYSVNVYSEVNSETILLDDVNTKLDQKTMCIDLKKAMEVMIKLKEENWILATELTAMKESYNSMEKNMNSIKETYTVMVQKQEAQNCILATKLAAIKESNNLMEKNMTLIKGE